MLTHIAITYWIIYIHEIFEPKPYHDDKSRMDAVGTRVGDETGLAMAEAIKHNGCLMWNHPCSGAKRFSVPYTAT